jgi:hypothetical protein
MERGMEHGKEQRGMERSELRAGDWVEVRSVAEILGTLDGAGSREGMPFMPEMLRCCGRRFRVAARADKVCDTSHLTGSRRVPGAVFLQGLRCDGSAHGGCQAECLLFWKEVWLRPVSGPAALAEDPRAPTPEALAALERSARAPAGADGAEHYRCQATQMHGASEQLRALDPRPYVQELLNGNASLGRFLKVSLRATVREPGHRLGLIPDAPVHGTRSGPPAAEAPLGLGAGDWVRVKSKEQIAATLNEEGKHRGLWFDREMVPFCGKTFQVRRRVKRILDERSGKLIELRNDCVTLEGVVCPGEWSAGRWLCTRAIFPYWRECWLERVEPPR